MRGIGHSSIEQDEFGVNKDAGLLNNPFAGYRRSYVPDRSNQVEAQHGRLFQNGATTQQEIKHPRRFCESDSDGRSLETQMRSSPLSIDEGVGKAYMEKVDADQTIHGGLRVACALKDGRQDLDEYGAGNHEEDDCRIGKGELNDGGFCTELLHDEPIAGYPKAGQRKRYADRKP